MLSFIISRFFAIQILVLLTLALANYFSAIKLGFIQDLLLLPLLTIFLVYHYCKKQNALLTTEQSQKVIYALILSDALIQAVLTFSSPQGIIAAQHFINAALTYAAVMVFHSLMIYFAVGYSKTLFEKRQALS
ncbi:hypothetical protein [Rheinheimera faecalis]|uniref:hypothetical protein n=1 Tax=Rheinheimera faecalis TaxID=2901141 RepID=UPI001E47C8AF|nr:hypothetical protein [Rheinheimera faecalis]